MEKLTTESGLVVEMGERSMVVTLDLVRSEVLAGEERPDGRELDDVRRAVRREVVGLLGAHGAARAEVYAHADHGGVTLDVITLGD